jgi:RNA polymerase sigma-70 factor (family 1)
LSRYNALGIKSDNELKQSFRKLFQAYYDPLCQVAYKYLNNASETEDVVQGVFSQLWSKRHQIEWGDKLVHYLYKSVKNNAIDNLRRKKNQFEYDQDKMEEIPDNTPIESEITESLQIQLIKLGINKLPPRCREIFTMQKMSGMTYQEIADELGISIKTVENQMVKALSFLRTFYEENRKRHGL